MKRLTVLFLVVLFAVAVPALGSHDNPTVGCDTSTGVTATALLPDTGPVCTFDLTCVSDFCVYVVALNVNGTGQVSGEMSVEKIGPPSPSARAEFLKVPSGGPAANPSCGPALFRCSYGGRFEVGATVLSLGNTIARVTCAASGLAALEAVQCTATNFVDENNPQQP